MKYKKVVGGLAVVVLAGLVAWGFAALPDQSKQDKFGASIESGIGQLLITADDKPIAADTKSAEISSESVNISGPAGSGQARITVLVSPLSASAGESVTVTVATVNDTPIFLPMDIYLESATGLTFAKGSIVDIDGEGNRFGSITIPEDAEPGIWKVKTIEITNTAGAIASYFYGTDIFSTFTVE